MARLFTRWLQIVLGSLVLMCMFYSWIGNEHEQDLIDKTKLRGSEHHQKASSQSALGSEHEEEEGEEEEEEGEEGKVHQHHQEQPPIHELHKPISIEVNKESEFPEGEIDFLVEGGHPEEQPTDPSEEEEAEEFAARTNVPLPENVPNEFIFTWPVAGSNATFIPHQVRLKFGRPRTFATSEMKKKSWIKRAFREMGLREVPKTVADVSWGAWVGHLQSIADGYDPFAKDWGHLNSRPLMNVIHNALGQSGSGFSKAALLQTLETVAEKFGCSSYQLDIAIPVTFPFDSRKACEELFDSPLSLWETWIVKPCCLKKGQGMQIVQGSKWNDLAIAKSKNPDYCDIFDSPSSIMEGVVQQFIDRPLLWGNRRFHIRSYVLIASTVPVIVFQHRGYIRLSPVPHEVSDITSQITNLIHTTANDIFTWEDLSDYLRETGVGDDVFGDRWEPEMIRLTRNIFSVAYVEYFLRSPGAYRLLAVDWVVDEDLNLFLLEVNLTPLTTYDGIVHIDKHFDEVFTSLISIVFEIHTKGIERWRLEDPEFLRHWQLVLVETDLPDSQFGCQTESSVAQGCKNKPPRGVRGTDKQEVDKQQEESTSALCVPGQSCFYGFCEADHCKCLYFADGPCCLPQNSTTICPRVVADLGEGAASQGVVDDAWIVDGVAAELYESGSEALTCYEGSTVPGEEKEQHERQCTVGTHFCEVAVKVGRKGTGVVKGCSPKCVPSATRSCCSTDLCNDDFTNVVVLEDLAP